MDVVEYFIKKGLHVGVKNKVSHLTVVNERLLFFLVYVTTVLVGVCESHST